jgi:outer membrane protein TolC
MHTAAGATAVAVILTATVLMFGPMVGQSAAQNPAGISEIRYLPPVEDVASGPATPAVMPSAVTSPATISPANCQLSRRLTLEEARQLALANNKALALAHLNIDEKLYATSAATKDYYPKILGSVTYFHFDNPLGTVLTTGGTILPTSVPVNVVNQDAALSTAFIAQPITKLIAVNAEVQIDRADENIAKAQLDKGAKDVLSGVTQVYYGLLGAQRIQAALGLQQTMLEQALAVQPSPDLRINLVEARQGLVQVQGQVQELTDQLNDLLSFPPGTLLELADPVPPLPPVASADQAVQMAVACNPEIREAQQGVAKAEAAFKVAKMDYLPDVNIIGGYANQTDASYIQPNFTYLGITASYTFWEWGKKNDVLRQRETDMAMAHQNLQVTQDKIVLAARKSYVDFDQALQTYRLADEMVQACQDAEKTATTPATVMATKGATAKAQLEYMKDEIAYRVAHAQLMSAIGQDPGCQ